MSWGRAPVSATVALFCVWALRLPRARVGPPFSDLTCISPVEMYVKSSKHQLSDFRLDEMYVVVRARRPPEQAKPESHPYSVFSNRPIAWSFLFTPSLLYRFWICPCTVLGDKERRSAMLFAEPPCKRSAYTCCSRGDSPNSSDNFAILARAASSYVGIG